MGFWPYSVRSFTSIEAKPKIALVGTPREVAIVSGQREERAVDEAVPVDQEQLAGGLGGHAAILRGASEADRAS